MIGIILVLVSISQNSSVFGVSEVFGVCLVSIHSFLSVVILLFVISLSFSTVTVVFTNPLIGLSVFNLEIASVLDFSVSGISSVSGVFSVEISSGSSISSDSFAIAIGIQDISATVILSKSVLKENFRCSMKAPGMPIQFEVPTR
jgi:hypothetical protein